MDAPYDITAFPAFAVTVDIVLLTIRRGEHCVLVVKRGEEPFSGKWALPGGFVHREPAHRAESLAEAAKRELREETGLGLKNAPYLEQLGAYGDPGRDPRGNAVTVAYLVVGAGNSRPLPGGDAAAVGWLPVRRVFDGYQLAFDHDQIVKDAVERVRDRIQYTALAAAYCGPRFSISNLRRAYEIVWGREPDVGLDPGNFHHRVTGMEGLLRKARSQEQPIGFKKRGLDSRPRQKAARAAPRSEADAPTGHGHDQEIGETRDGVFALEDRDGVAPQELAGSSSLGGPRPLLYEPGPLIEDGGYSTPLERPILNRSSAALPPKQSPRQGRSNKSS